MNTTPNTTAPADPIFQAIELCKMLWDNWQAIGKTEPQDGLETPEYAVYQERFDGAGELYRKGTCELLKITPTTLQGAIALIEFCLTENSLLFGDDGPDADAGKNEHHRNRTLLRRVAGTMYLLKVQA